jgi:hypothetical protein
MGNRKHKHHVVQKEWQETEAKCGSNRGTRNRSCMYFKGERDQIICKSRILCCLNSWHTETTKLPFFLVKNSTEFFLRKKWHKIEIHRLLGTGVTRTTSLLSNSLFIKSSYHSTLYSMKYWHKNVRQIKNKINFSKCKETGIFSHISARSKKKKCNKELIQSNWQLAFNIYLNISTGKCFHTVHQKACRLNEPCIL